MASDETKNDDKTSTARVVHAATRPVADDVNRWTDHYFNRTKQVVGQFGDKQVTYAVFMRRPVIFAPRIMLDWLTGVAEARDAKFDITLNYKEGQWVGAGEPLIYITGSMYHLVDLETLYLQKLGAACVAANNAFTMCVELPDVSFLAMDAPSCRRFGNGRNHGLCRIGGIKSRTRPSWGQRLHWQCHRGHGALFRPNRQARAPCRMR